MKSLITTLTALLLALAGHTQQAKSNIDFIPNRGQWPAEALYRTTLGEGAAYFTGEGFVYTFYSGKDAEAVHDLKHRQADVSKEIIHRHAFRVRFAGANNQCQIAPGAKRPNYYNFFKGKDPAGWAGGVPAYDGIRYGQLYPGIDLKVYASGAGIEYDLIVAPGARPAVVRMQYEGVAPVLLPNGNLQIKTSVNEIVEQAPVAYQIIAGQRKTVPVRFALSRVGEVSFVLPAGYDKRLPLVIDPVLVFATYSGSTGNTYGFSATYNADGSLFAGGECFDNQWPVTTGAFQSTFGGIIDAGINKYSPDGSSLIYSTYYGGDGGDVPSNMVCNAVGELIVAGATSSMNAPTTPGCYDASFNGAEDIYVAHFNAAGSALIGATYLGGGDYDGVNVGTLSPNYGDQNRGEVLTDAGGNILVSSSSSSQDFPVTPGCYQATLGGSQDGIVAKLNPNCSQLLFSTYLGGSGADACFSIVQNTQGDLAVCGGTQSSNFPTTTGVLHATFQGSTDGFASLLSSDGTQLLKSTFLGTGEYDHAFKIQTDNDDNILVCGQTNGAYPVTAGVYTNANSGIFIDKLAPDLSSSIQSTRIGHDISAGINLVPTAFLSDVCGNIYFCGFQAQAGLPLSPDAHQTSVGGFWLCVLRLNMTSLYYATFMGAAGDHVDGGTSRFDPNGIVYHSVCNFSGFPTTAGSWQPNDASSGYDVASFKFDFAMNGVRAGIGLNGASTEGCAPYALSFENLSVNGATFLWDFNDGATSTLQTPPAHTFTNPGTYEVMLVAYNDDIAYCNHSDTARITITVSDANLHFLTTDSTICAPTGITTVSAPATNVPGNFSYTWLPDPAITSALNQPAVTVNVTQPVTLTVILSQGSGSCASTDSALITLIPSSMGPIVTRGDTTLCAGDTATLSATGGVRYHWTPAAALSSPDTAVTRAWPGQTTAYTVRISDAGGCEEARTVTVTVINRTHADAGPDDIIRTGSQTMLQGSGGEQYQWTPAGTLSAANVPNPMASPAQTTTYYLTVANSSGQCPSYDSVTIGVTNAAVPDAFTPNGDKRNDVFKLVMANPLVKLEYFRIFDRYGSEVFATTDITQGWDGIYNNRSAEIGTYFWMVSYKIGSKEYLEKGDLTLIR